MLGDVAAARPDFSRTAADYARHRAGFPAGLMHRLAAQGIARPGARVVDLGTGTGGLARLFAQYGCEVTGVDIAVPLLEQARRLDRESGVSVEYVEAPAEATGLSAGAFDVVSAGQCWHWFDRPAAAREAMRLLGVGGAIVIAHLDWLAFTGNVVAATEELILRYMPAGAPAHGPWPFAHGIGVYPQWLVDLQEAGFVGIETFSFDLELPYTREAWVGRLRASAPIAGTLDEERVRAFTGELTALLAERFPEETLAVPHRVWAVTARKPARERDEDAGEPTDEVRVAHAGDAPAIGRLLFDFNTEFGDPTPDPQWLAMRVEQLLTEGLTTVLLSGSGPDGLALLRFRPSLWSGALECYLAELYVAPERRGRGCGRALMLAAIEHARARGADYMDLNTAESDVAARALYESLGFSEREGKADGPRNLYYELGL